MAAPSARALCPQKGELEIRGEGGVPQRSFAPLEVQPAARLLASATSLISSAPSEVLLHRLRRNGGNAQGPAMSALSAWRASMAPVPRILRTTRLQAPAKTVGHATAPPIAQRDVSPTDN